MGWFSSMRCRIGAETGRESVPLGAPRGSRTAAPGSRHFVPCLGESVGFPSCEENSNVWTAKGHFWFVEFCATIFPPGSWLVRSNRDGQKVC